MAKVDFFERAQPLLIIFTSSLCLSAYAMAAELPTSSPTANPVTQTAQTPFANTMPSFMTIELSQGYVNRDFSWSVTESSSSDNVLSTLNYQNLKIQTTQFSFDFENTFKEFPDTQIQGFFLLGEIYDGRMEDLDFSHSNAQTELQTRSLADLAGSKTFHTGLNFSTDFSTSSKHSSIFNIGLEWQSDQFRQRNGQQTRANGADLANPKAIDNLDSSYVAHWIGPYIGASKIFAIPGQSFTFNAKLHSHVYYASGQWNLRSSLAQPKSFEHNALGGGVSFSAQHQIVITKKLKILQTASLQKMSTLGGTDELFRSNGTSVVTRLNPIARQEFSYNIGLRLQL